MLRPTMVAAVAATVILTIGATAIPAQADDGIGPVDCASDPDNPGCDIEVGSSGENGSSSESDTSDGGGSSGDGSNTDDNCHYELADSQGDPPTGATSGAWYVKICLGSDGQLFVSPATWLVSTPTTSPETLAQTARSRLTLPTLIMRWNPAPPADQILHIPTWLWVDSASWVSRSATASVPGLSVTATATPTQVVFDPGDEGEPVTCAGPGTAWQSGMDPLASSPTSCGYTYPKPASYTLTATMTWTVTWVGGGTSGTVDPLTTNASQSLRVVEAGALNTSGG